MAEYLEESDSERSDCAELQKRSYLLDLLESCDLLDLLESYDLLELLERYDLLQQFREENGDEENGAKDNGAEENSAEENGAEENSAEENSAEENGVETNGTELLQNEVVKKFMMTEEMIDSLPTEDIRKFLKKKWYELEHMAGSTVVETYDDKLMEEKKKNNGGLAVAAFNIRCFGPTKSKNKKVMKILSKIIRRYDIILIQEIRDINEETIPKLIERVNIESEAQYSFEISEREGESDIYKEQYAYVYRVDTVEIVEMMTDTECKPIDRPPFAVLIKSLILKIPNVILIGLHTKPTKAKFELKLLKCVYSKATEFFHEDSAIILGDLNADCSYLSKTEQVKLKDSCFRWLIASSMKTAISSDCAYDRFIAAGPIQRNVAPNTVGVFNFDQAYGLSHEDAKSVSDHYVIELLLRGKKRIRHQ